METTAGIFLQVLQFFSKQPFSKILFQKTAYVWFVEYECNLLPGYGDGDDVHMAGSFTVEPCVKVCTAYKRTTNSLTNGISLKPNDCFCEVNMTAATVVAGWKSCFLQEKIIGPTGNPLLILFVFDFPFYLTMAIHS